MTPSHVAERGGEPFVAGWLVTKPGPFTTTELETAYRLTDPALVLDAQRPDQTDADVRRNILIIGIAAALAVLSIAVALLRVETHLEDRTLEALGADRRTRKRIAATTAAFLALGAATLALPAGYLSLVAITSDPGADYPLVFPMRSIASLTLGVPVLGAIGAYLMTSQHDGVTN